MKKKIDVTQIFDPHPIFYEAGGSVRIEVRVDGVLDEIWEVPTEVVLDLLRTSFPPGGEGRET